MNSKLLASHIQLSVATALREDIGDGDISAELIDENTIAQATIISREPAILCGSAWVNEVFEQLSGDVEISWAAADGDRVTADQVLCTIAGRVRALLTGERTALNFLQLLCATATATRRYVDLIAGTGARLLDTRKTVPGLRVAQKYAVLCATTGTAGYPGPGSGPPSARLRLTTD